MGSYDLKGYKSKLRTSDLKRGWSLVEVEVSEALWSATRDFSFQSNRGKLMETIVIISCFDQNHTKKSFSEVLLF